MNKYDLFPVITVSGTPYEIGYAHGSKAKKQIDVSIDTYKSMFFTYSGISWDKAKAYAKTFIPVITEYDSELIDEIKGIADGAGYGFEEILALNVRSEIVLQGGLVADIPLEGCTAFGFTPEFTEDGCTWIGQNWDWKSSQLEGCIILNILQNGKPNISMVTEAGIIGKIGYNSAGIGLCLNALASDKKAAGKVVPLHIAMRGALNAGKLSDAIEALCKINLSCCAHLMLGRSTGEAISLEIGPDSYDVIYAENGWLTHTNHFFHPRMLNVTDIQRINTPDSVLRLGRINKMIKLTDHKIGLNDMKRFMTDHTDYPDSICRHEDPINPKERRSSTVFSIIMNLDRTEMFFTPGMPCETNYRLYKFI